MKLGTPREESEQEKQQGNAQLVVDTQERKEILPAGRHTMKEQG